MADTHVLPINDLIEHLQLRQCPCRPDVEDYGESAVVVHHAADGREYFETAKEEK